VRRRILQILSAVTILSVLSSVALIWEGRQGVPTEKKIEYVTSCMTDQLEPGSFLYNSTQGGDPTNVFQTRIDCARTALGDPADTTEVGEVLNAMFALSRSNDTARLACHDLAHEYGAWAYDALDDSALVPGYSDCGFGYYHGAMQRALRDGQVLERIPALRSFCELLSITTDPFDPGVFTFCSHGVGHAVGTSKVPLPDGIDACQGMESAGEWPTILRKDGSEDPLHIPPELECFTGFLNERFSTRQRDGAAVPTAQAGLDECISLPSPYRSRCLSYNVFYADFSIADIRALCSLLAESDLRSGCWEGVGYRGSRVLVTDGEEGDSALTSGLDLSNFESEPYTAARFVERLCEGDDGQSCYMRFALETVQRLQKPALMRDICALLDQEINRSECLRAINRVASIQGE
jgi:hypothetical protein